ncbi:MAG: hypothetical protein VB066_01800 [Paludibacter sp.]|nr:hypothetical protein [Paludibacter sp.]
MQINRIKLIADLLHIRMRSSLLIQLLFALTSEVQTVLNKFRINVPDWLYQINSDASVISLQHQIKRELDVDAVITELSGQPIDFLVTVNGFVDENRLRALIEGRKLAGKSFVFQTGNMEYECEWQNYACVQEYTDNIIYVTMSINYVGLQPQFAPYSNITVVVRVYAGTHYKDFTRIMTAGSESDSFLANVYQDPGGAWMVNTSAIILSITPSKDYMYKYKKAIE